MEYIIFLAKKLFNYYEFNYEFAYATSFYFTKKEEKHNFVMFAQELDIKQTDSPAPIDNATTNIPDKPKGKLALFFNRLFNKTLALPSPDDYTMDDWIASQRGPISRIMHAISNRIQQVASRRAASKETTINAPIHKREDGISYTTYPERQAVNPDTPKIFPGKLPLGQKSSKPFSPLQDNLKPVDLNFDDTGLEHAPEKITLPDGKEVVATTEIHEKSKPVGASHDDDLTM